MPPFLAIVLGVCGTGALIALSSPFVMLYLRPVDGARRARARRRAAYSGFVIACVVAFMLHLSFAWHALNVIVIFAVLMCAGALALAVFQIGPAWLAVPLGLVISCVWLIGFAATGIMLLTDGSPVMARLDSGLYCRESEYGGALGDSGVITEIFRRYLFIDHKIYTQIESFVYPNDTVPAPAGLPDAPARCHALLDAQRRAGANGG